MKLQIGDLFFWYSREDLFGKAIDFYNKRTFGVSDTTHIGIISQVEKDRVLIMAIKYFPGQVVNFNYIPSKPLYSLYNMSMWLIYFRNKFNFKSRAVHTGIITKVDEKNRTLELAEALNNFQFTTKSMDSMDEWLTDGTADIYEPLVPVENVREIANKYTDTNADKEGNQATPYGWKTIAVIALSFITRKTFNYSDGVKTLICSEGTARILYEASNKKIVMGFNPKDKPREESEFSIPFDLLTPDHFTKSKYFLKLN